MRHIKYARRLLTTDSFTSHVAQLLRDDFVLVLNRDLREGVVHPGADPVVVGNHAACAPCNYQERHEFKCCVAGYQYCIALRSRARPSSGRLSRQSKRQVVPEPERCRR